MSTTFGSETTKMMTRSCIDEPAPQVDRHSRFPALAKLGVSDGDFAELAHQGWLATERRHDRTYYKLRFRRAGRQIVRCVGSAQQAALVAQELKVIQSTRQLRLELNELGRAARQLQRDAKTKLEPLLAERGFRFHGRAIRRSRRSAHEINVSFPLNQGQEVDNESMS